MFALVVICALLYYYTYSSTPTPKDANFVRFQRIYLTVYMLAMLGDWLQGPHVYALYQSYNMTKHQIELLFICGFGSSMLFGTVIGSFADKYGRRFNCLLYGVTYGLACLTKHFNNFGVLMGGRVLAGIATSILYSAFESWLIYEHKARGFEEKSLGNLFANAYLGNSVVAISAGVVAQYAANSFGYVAPFDTSLLVLICMIVLISMYWTENFGDSSVELKQSFFNAYQAIVSDKRIMMLGLVQGLFEGCMYVFVLEWTPALTIQSDVALDNAKEPPIPHGFIFAAFMVAMMIGSNLFKVLSNTQEVEKFMRIVLAVATCMFAVPVLFPQNQVVIYWSFIVFEVCVGIFWPAMGTMRGKYVPESTRSTIMNFFRIPLNFIVVVLLLQDLQLKFIFQTCVVLLTAATAAQFVLESQPAKSSSSSELDAVKEKSQSNFSDDQLQNAKLLSETSEV